MHHENAILLVFRKDVEKYVEKIGNTNAELQKQIHSQEELHKK